MDEGLSWRAKLARRNINILGVDDNRWYYEFMYHPRPGQTKWSKTFYQIPQGELRPLSDSLGGVCFERTVDDSPETIATNIQAEVLALRKELEG